MSKTEVYSWRLAPVTKAALEAAARETRGTVSAVLEDAVRLWLRERRRRLAGDEREQERLHAMVARSFGCIHGRNPERAEQARALVRRRLEARRAR